MKLIKNMQKVAGILIFVPWLMQGMEVDVNAQEKQIDVTERFSPIEFDSKNKIYKAELSLTSSIPHKDLLSCWIADNIQDKRARNVAIFLKTCSEEHLGSLMSDIRDLDLKINMTGNKIVIDLRNVESIIASRFTPHLGDSLSIDVTSRIPLSDARGSYLDQSYFSNKKANSYLSYLIRQKFGNLKINKETRVLIEIRGSNDDNYVDKLLKIFEFEQKDDSRTRKCIINLIPFEKEVKTRLNEIEKKSRHDAAVQSDLSYAINTPLSSQPRIKPPTTRINTKSYLFCIQYDVAEEKYKASEKIKEATFFQKALSKRILEMQPKLDSNITMLDGELLKIYVKVDADRAHDFNYSDYVKASLDAIGKISYEISCYAKNLEMITIDMRLLEEIIASSYKKEPLGEGCDVLLGKMSVADPLGLADYEASFIRPFVETIRKKLSKNDTEFVVQLKSHFGNNETVKKELQECLKGSFGKDLRDNKMVFEFDLTRLENAIKNTRQEDAIEEDFVVVGK